MTSSRWFLLPLALLLGACGTTAPSRPLPTVASVDLRRYAGQWHEVAQLPNSFQKEGESATALYLPETGGGLRVVNTAQAKDGSSRSIRGHAEVVPGSGNARLRVKFDGLAGLAPANREGNYWIIALDREHYAYAMVGTPDRKYLWILARRAGLERSTLQALLQQAKAQGFATDRMVFEPAA